MFIHGLFRVYSDFTRLFRIYLRFIYNLFRVYVPKVDTGLVDVARDVLPKERQWRTRRTCLESVQRVKF